MKTNNKVVENTILLLIGTIVSKLLGFLRELVVAYKFGAGSISDAFLLTNNIPTLIFVSVGTAVSINYIPCYSSLQSEEEKKDFTSNLYNIILLILLAGCMLVLLFPEVVINVLATGLDVETKYYAIPMLRIVMFSIIPIITAQYFQAYLQVKGKFNSTAFYGVITNAVMIIITLASKNETFYLLSIGTVLANTTGLFFVLKDVKQCGYRHRVIVNFKDINVKKMVIWTIPLLAEDLSSSLSLMVDRNLASYLDEGTISGLSYAGTLGNIASTMIASSIITATFPRYTQMIADGKHTKFRDEFSKYAKYLCYILAPIAIFMIFMAEEIVEVVFVRGAFDAHASQIVGESMQAYAVGVIPMGVQAYLVRGFYALKNTKTPVKIKVFSLLCNILLNLVLVSQFKHVGIAFSTSISYFLAYSLLLFTLSRKYKMNCVGRMNRDLFTSVGIAAILAGICKLFEKTVLYSIGALGQCLIIGVIFVSTYLLVVYITQREIREDIKSTFRGK